MKPTVHKVLMLAVGALFVGGLAVALSSVPTEAMPLCWPGETLDKGRCVSEVPDEELSRETRAATTSTTTTSTTTTTTTTTTVPPIRTIDEGQSTTFTTPTPQNRQEMFCSARTTITTYTVVIIDGIEHGTTTSRSRPAGVFHLPPGEERTSDEPFTCGTGSKRTVYGICRGPYTVELGSRDDRVEEAGGRRIRVTTDADDNLDDTGTVEVIYYLHGTRTKSSAHYSGTDVVTNVGCSLQEAVNVNVHHAPRPGMTAAVSRHAPAQEYLDTPSTTEWECTQAVIDAGVQCPIDTVISTTVQPTFPTPRGCTVVVTVAKNGKGFGSTNCLTSAQTDLYEAEIRAKHSDEQAISVSDLPTCPESTHTDVMNAIPDDASGRKRCVAKN